MRHSGELSYRTTSVSSLLSFSIAESQEGNLISKVSALAAACAYHNHRRHCVHDGVQTLPTYPVCKLVTAHGRFEVYTQHDLAT